MSTPVSSSFLQQLSRSSQVRGSTNGILLSKTCSPTTVTQCWLSPRKSDNWIIVGNGYISINETYPYFFLNNLFVILYCALPFLSYNYMSFARVTWCLYFSLSGFIISPLKWSSQHDTHIVLLFLKTYN